MTCSTGPATGTVTFLDGTETLGTTDLAPGTTTATLTVDSLPSGTHTVRARSNGTGTCPASESGPVTVTVTGPVLPVTGVGLPATVAADLLFVLTGAVLFRTTRRRPPARRSSAR